MTPTIKQLRGRPLTVLMAIISEYPQLPSVKRLAEITGYRRQRIPEVLKILDYYGLIKRYHRSAWILINSPENTVSLLCECPILGHSMSQNGTLSRSDQFPQCPKMGHSMSQNGTLSIHDDHDHDDDERIYKLNSLGFSDSRNYCQKHDKELIDQWLEWEESLTPQERRNFKNLGGFIRKAINRKETPVGKRNSEYAELYRLGVIKH